MKKLLFISFFAVSQFYLGAQTIIMNDTTNNQTFTTCGALIHSSSFDMDRYPSPVADIGYSANENYAITICSGSSQPVRVKLTSLDFGTIIAKLDGSFGGEYLEVFDGPNTGFPLLGNILDWYLNGSILTSTNASNCITIRFQSDATTFGKGFLIAAGCKPTECIPGSGIPAASDYCIDAPEICSIDGYCGNTSGWYTTINDSIVAKTPNDLRFGQDTSAAWNYLHNSSWVKFTAEDTTVNFDITSANCANSRTGIQAIIYDSDCSTFTPKSNVISQSQGRGGPGTSRLTGTGLTVGKKYYLLVDGFDGNICDYSIKVIDGADVVRVVANGSTTICSSECIELTTHSTRSAAGYAWSVLPVSGTSGLSTAGGVKDSTVTFCPPTAGSYKVIGTAIGVCGASASDTIVINARTPAITSFIFTDNGNGNYLFTNTSTGNYNQSHWAFGDGNISTTTNSNHNFSSNGTFVVVLTVNDSTSSCFDYFIDSITVAGVPSPNQCSSGFVMYPDKVTSNRTVVNSSTGTNLTYLWNFGDGNTSVLTNPTHIYSTAGPFYLCLTIDDGNGCVDKYCDSIGKNGVVFNKASGFSINVISAPIITGINSESKSNPVINIYPNPTSNQLTINTELKVSEIIIVDITGKIIISTKKNTNTINVANLSDGIYFIKLISNEGTITKKFVKH